ncbi:MAG: hypothetical protein ACHQLA_07110 [Ignavibacteriales bacterium]
MMKKNISIWTLLVLFLVSTTGLPVFSHYCGMMNERSITECGDCGSEKKEMVSCCSEEQSQNKLILSSEKPICCVEEFDYKKIEDDFSQSINSNIISGNLIIVSIVKLTPDSAEELSTQKQNNNLPPPKSGKLLLQTIHQLKLDPPAC